MMNFDIPEYLSNYLRELDDFIEAQILPLQMQDDNNRFFDHRREHARTDWDREGLPNEEWESLLWEAKHLADAAGGLYADRVEASGDEAIIELGCLAKMVAHIRGEALRAAEE